MAGFVVSDGGFLAGFVYSGAPYVSPPTGIISRTSGADYAGVAGTFTWTLSTIMTAYAALSRGGVQEGARVAVGPGTSGTVELTPQDSGSYTVSLWTAATGGTLLDVSDSWEVAEPVIPNTELVIGSQTIEGTGAGANAITWGGTAFGDELLGSYNDLALRRIDTSALVPIQWHPTSFWPSGAVRTIRYAVRCPSLADLATLDCEWVRGIAGSVTGAALDPETELTGRSVSITITPDEGDPWVFDPLANLTSDRWFDGPLLCSTRVEADIPSASFSGSTSGRLIVDLYIAQDGTLRVDHVVANDKVGLVGGAPATVTVTAACDGVTYYDTTGTEWTCGQYKHFWAWTERKTGGAVTRPILRASLDDLVAGAVTLDMLRYTTLYQTHTNSILSAYNSTAWNQPYASFGVARKADMTGGRAEIGVVPQPHILWLRGNARDARFASLLQCRSACARPDRFWDSNMHRWINAEDHPRFSQHYSGTMTPGASLNSADGLPSDQRDLPGADGTSVGEFGRDAGAHQGAFFAIPALLEANRYLYDSLASQAAYAAVVDWRRNNGTGLGAGNWRGLTPDVATGRVMMPAIFDSQSRSVGHRYQDIVHADVLLPADYDNRQHYTNLVQAWVNGFHNARSAVQARQGELFAYLEHPNSGTEISPWMQAWHTHSLLQSVAAKIHNANTIELLSDRAEFTANAANPNISAAWRQGLCGAYATGASGGVYASTWSEYDDLNSTPIPITWDSGPYYNAGDYHRQTLSARLLCALSDVISLDARIRLMDSVTLFRSEYITNASGYPGIKPDSWNNSDFQQNSCWAPSNWSWDLDDAPVIPEGQEFTVAAGGSAGDAVGLIRTTGCAPRASEPEGTDAWEIVSQSPGANFTITRGGGLRKAGSVAAGTYTVIVRAHVYDDASNHYQSSAVDVTVVVE